MALGCSISMPDIAPGEASHFIPITGPAVSPADSRQSLIEKDKAIRLPHEYFYPVSPSPAEKEDSAPSRIHVKLILYNGTEAVYGLPHIRVAADDVDLINGRDVADHV